MRHILLGGTGTLGSEIARQLSQDPANEIVIFSRDEAKQKEMMRHIKAQYVIGDIRDRNAVSQVVRTADVVYILAAIKHVDVAEANPLEAIKTNLLGTVNVAEECISHIVPWVVFSNTDKAVLPITTYGYTKALAQDYLLSLNRLQEQTRFSAFNWGNIIASRGSVIPDFVRTLIEHNTISITDKRMSRFWLPISMAARFMINNFKTAPLDKAVVPPIKAAKLMRVAETVADILRIENYKTEIKGLRCAEKIHEVLETSHTKCLRSDTCEQYSDDELRAMLKDIVLSEAAKFRGFDESVHLRTRRKHGKAVSGNLGVHGASVVGARS